uniref:Uncharacterized protein n=1 Tax=Pavo cristatus TaxID=9049 RepID=A0A8C9G6W4_PAVCR
MREIVHIQAGQCGNQIGAKVRAAAPPSARGFTTCSRVPVFVHPKAGFSRRVPTSLGVSGSARLVLAVGSRSGCGGSMMWAWRGSEAEVGGEEILLVSVGCGVPGRRCHTPAPFFRLLIMQNT